MQQYRTSKDSEGYIYGMCHRFCEKSQGDNLTENVKTVSAIGERLRRWVRCALLIGAAALWTACGQGANKRQDAGGRGNVELELPEYVYATDWMQRYVDYILQQVEDSTYGMYKVKFSYVEGDTVPEMFLCSDVNILHFCQLRGKVSCASVDSVEVGNIFDKGQRLSIVLSRVRAYTGKGDMDDMMGLLVSYGLSHMYASSDLDKQLRWYHWFEVEMASRFGNGYATSMDRKAVVDSLIVGYLDLCQAEINTVYDMIYYEITKSGCSFWLRIRTIDRLWNSLSDTTVRALYIEEVRWMDSISKELKRMLPLLSGSLCSDSIDDYRNVIHIIANENLIYAACNLLHKDWVIYEGLDDMEETRYENPVCVKRFLMDCLHTSSDDYHVDIADTCRVNGLEKFRAQCERLDGFIDRWLSARWQWIDAVADDDSRPCYIGAGSQFLMDVATDVSDIQYRSLLKDK